MNFSLQFRTLEGHDPVRMKRLVLSNIKEHARRTTFQDLVVLQMGDLLLSMDSITVHIHDHPNITPPSNYGESFLSESDFGPNGSNPENSNISHSNENIK